MKANVQPYLHALFLSSAAFLGSSKIAYAQDVPTLQNPVQTNVQFSESDRNAQNIVHASDIIVQKIKYERERIQNIDDPNSKSHAEQALMGRVHQILAMHKNVAPERFGRILNDALTQSLNLTTQKVRYERDLAFSSAAKDTFSDASDYTGFIPHPSFQTSSKAFGYIGKSMTVANELTSVAVEIQLNKQEQDIIDWIIDGFEAEKVDAKWFLKYGGGRLPEDEPLFTVPDPNKKTQFHRTPAAILQESVIDPERSATAMQGFKTRILDTGLMTEDEKADTFARQAIQQLNDDLLNAPAGSERAASLKQNISKFELAIHNRQVSNLQQTAQNAAQILYLFEPELASDIQSTSNAALRIYDGMNTMGINNAIDMASMANVAGGVGLAIALMNQNTGPSAEEIMFDMLNAVLENQKRMIAQLASIEDLVDKLQSDVDYLIAFAQKNQDITQSVLIELHADIEKISSKLDSSRTYSREIAEAKEVLDLEITEGTLHAEFRNPLSSNRPGLLECFKDQDNCSVHEKILFSDLKEHITTIVQYATDPKSIDNIIFKDERDIISVDVSTIEGEFMDYNAAERNGHLKGIIDWLNVSRNALGLSTHYIADQSHFDGVANPTLFTDTLVPLYARSANWHFNRAFIAQQTNKMEAQQDRILNAARQSRDTLPIAMATYAAYAETIKHDLDQFLRKRDVMNILNNRVFIDDKDYFEREAKHYAERSLHQRILETHNQGQLIALGVNLGIWEQKERDDRTTHRRARYRLHINDVKQARTFDKTLQQYTGHRYLLLTGHGKRLDRHINSAINEGSSTFRNFHRIIIHNPAYKLDENTPHILRKNGKPQNEYWLANHKTLITPHETTRNLHPIILSKLALLSAKEMRRRLADNVRDWNTTKTNNDAMANAVRSKYVLDTLIAVGFGNCDGATPEFNPLHQITRDIPKFSGQDGVFQPNNFENALKNLQTLQSSIHMQSPEQLTTLPAKADVDYCEYSYGDTRHSTELLKLVAD